jgi:NADH-quinone oxidoreductase subunit M
MPGVYAAVRVLVPSCPAPALEVMGILSLITAVYAAGLAVVQIDARRFVACLCMSSTALVLTGLAVGGELAATASLSLWVAAGLTLTGTAFALRAVESRVGEIGLVGFRGLYDCAPPLAVCFLIASLGVIGFPGTLGFLPMEVLIERTFAANTAVGIGVVLTVAITGFAVVRAYALVFTGGRHRTAIPLAVTRRERWTVLAVAVLVLGGGLLPQPLLDSRQRAATPLIEQRQRDDTGPIHPAPSRP